MWMLVGEKKGFIFFSFSTEILSYKKNPNANGYVYKCLFWSKGK